MKNYVVRTSEMDPGTVVEAKDFFVEQDRGLLYFRGRDGVIVAAYGQWISVQEAVDEDLP